MSIFDEVKRSISSTGKQVAKRTKEISDAVSIRSQINEEKENIAKLYATVGKKVFQNATEADEEKFFMEFTSIRSSLERKRELEELEAACQKALQQIKDRRYQEYLLNDDRKDIQLYGIAFCKKRCRAICERL